MISKAHHDLAVNDVRQLRTFVDMVFQGLDDVGDSLSFSSQAAFYDLVIEGVSKSLHRVESDLSALLRRVEHEEVEPNE